jgi:hypothetical protein
MRKKDPAGFRGPECLPALLSRDDFGAHDPLQARDLLADRGRRVAEETSGSFERPLVGDRAQSREMPELEADPLGYRIGPH